MCVSQSIRAINALIARLTLPECCPELAETAAPVLQMKTAAEPTRQFDQTQSQQGKFSKLTMQTRKQIITQTLRDHEKATGGRDPYSRIVKAVLKTRLIERSYLTCADFHHFDVNCCTACCQSEPHYEMIDVVLDDGRQHAWVCCTIRDILIRQTKRPPLPDPDIEKQLKLLGKIFRCKPDPIAENLHAANMAANSDEEKLYYCLKYVYHMWGRKRGHKKLETIVKRALNLLGGRPAKRCNESSPPESCGFCFRCGGLIYQENLTPGRIFHNCRAVSRVALKSSGCLMPEVSEKRKGGPAQSLLVD